MPVIRGIIMIEKLHDKQSNISTEGMLWKFGETVI